MKKAAILERLNLENLFNTFVGLPPRQQTLALAGVAGVVLLLLVLPLSLASGRLQALESRIEGTRSKMGALADQIKEFYKVRAKLEAYEGLLKNGFDESNEVAAALQEIAAGAQMKESCEVKGGKPTVPSEYFNEAIAEAKVRKTTLQQFVDLLYRVESDATKVLRVKTIKISRSYENPHLIDAVFELASYTLPEAKK